MTGRTYLLEAHLPRTRAGGPAAAAARARAAAEEMRREGTSIRCLNSFFLPEDELCFYLFEAPSPESVLAAFPCARVTEAVLSPEAET